MSETFKERIVKSTAAKRMMDAVSPVYDDSYAGCWLFEDIGREWDRLWEIIDELPDQLFPHTATWLLSLWERRYGITPNAADSIEERRRRIEELEAYPKPFIPAVLDRWVKITSGSRAYVDDNIGPYTFGVYIETQPDSTTVDIDQIMKHINAHKHSHMSYELVFQASGRVALGVETGYWRFPYIMTGSIKTGEHPQDNIVSGTGSSSFCVSPEAYGYLHPYDMTGTKPETNTLAAIADTGFHVDTATYGYIAPYQMADGHETGRLPVMSTGAGFSDSGIAASADLTGYAYPYQFTGGEQGASIRASPEYQGFVIDYALCGAKNL